MSLGPQYTSCVEATNFKPVNKAYVATLVVAAAAGTVAALFSGGLGLVIAIPALVEALHYTSEWMLNGKLICLHRDPAKLCGDHQMVWAIGEVADTEAIGEDKNPIDDIDNDYAMNLILVPFNMMAFGDSAEQNLALATGPAQPQGDLLSEQPGMPGFVGYFRTMIVTLSDQKYRAWTEVVGRDYGYLGIIGPDQQEAWADYVLKPENAYLLPQKRSVPVLHCEFEGSRIKAVLDATNAFSPGGSFCKSNWFTKFLCKVVQVIFSPVILILIAVAWASAADGDPADALEGGGTINNKDQVIVGGRWVYDGGHDGYNEFHATRIVQKVAYVPKDGAGFADFQKRWCAEHGRVPHTDPAGRSKPGTAPEGANPGPPLSPEQHITLAAQGRAENQWVLHPFVDGCQRSVDR